MRRSGQMKVGLGGCIGNGCGWKDMQLAVSRCFVMHNLHLAAIRIESDPDRIGGGAAARQAAWVPPTRRFQPKPGVQPQIPAVIRRDQYSPKEILAVLKLLFNGWQPQG